MRTVNKNPKFVFINVRRRTHAFEENDVNAHCLEECTRLYISDKRYAYPIRCVKN